MKKKVVGVVLAVVMVMAVLVGCAPAPAASNTGASESASKLTGTVKTGGSTSVEKVMNALIYQFQDTNKEVTIDYEMNGSGDGIKNTISGLYEIGHSSRELKTDGTENGLDAVPYAIDGIAIIVNKANGVQNLTKQQILDIFTGKVTNWNQVGGNDAAITVVSREVGSGTRSAIAELIGFELADKPETALVANATIADNTGAIQTQVSQNPNAIGYMSFSDVDASKVNTVKYENVAISTATLKDGSYKLKREFFLLTKTGAKLSDAGQAFMDFILSEEGQKIVADNSLLPIK